MVNCDATFIQIVSFSSRYFESSTVMGGNKVCKLDTKYRMAILVLEKHASIDQQRFVYCTSLSYLLWFAHMPVQDGAVTITRKISSDPLMLMRESASGPALTDLDHSASQYLHTVHPCRGSSGGMLPTPQRYCKQCW